MKKYKVFKDNEELNQDVQNPTIVFDNNIRTIDWCLNRLGSQTLEVDQVQTEGILVGQVNNVNIYIPEPESTIEIPSESDYNRVVWYNSLEHLISSGFINLQAGMIARTKGFYKPNDGGSSTYLIKSSLPTNIHGYALSTTVDGIGNILLGTNLFAELLVEEGAFVNLRQFGGQSLEDGVMVDNAPFMTKIFKYIGIKRYFCKIYIPSGHWCFKALNILHTIKTGMGYPMLWIEGEGPNTVCMPYDDVLEYIFKVGKYTTPLDTSIAVYEARGMQLKNLAFQCGKLPQELLTLYGGQKYLTTGALCIEHSTYSSFSNLTFNYIFNTVITISSDYETLFGPLKFNCCGGYRNGSICPLIKLDINHSYSSSVSANWFKLLHFHSCVGPFIVGINKNCTHNEFNCIIVTGSSEEYNSVCPDLNSAQTNSTVYYGVIDGIQGMTNFWPNMYITVMCCSMDSLIARDGVLYKLKAILHHEKSEHCHVYLGNIALPLHESYWVTYVNQGAISYSVKLLFSEKVRPFYCSNMTLPKHSVSPTDPRLIYGPINGSNYVTTTSTRESPYNLYLNGNSASSQIVFIAKAGKNYAVKLLSSSASSGYWINNKEASGTTKGLWVYYSNAWRKVGPVVAKNSELLGSNGNDRYLNILNFFCFNQDTLVRIAGVGYDFFYEQETYPANLIDLTLVSNDITSESNTSAIYNITKDSSISKVSAYVSNSTYFSVTITGSILVLTTNTTNSGSSSLYTNLMLVGKDSNGNIVTKVSFIPARQPYAS